MGQVLHGSATTTEAVRRAIQHSQESLRTLARRYSINQKTVAKWKRRSSVADVPTGPRDPRSTVLTVEEEAVVVAKGRSASTCPVRALEAWIAAAGVTSDPIFRAVDRWGHVSDQAMTGQAVANVVKAAAARVGLDPADFAGHSLRSGCATAAAAPRLMGHLRHAKYETTAKYVRRAEAFRDSVATAAGL
jgi:hypothetical protein